MRSEHPVAAPATDATFDEWGRQRLDDVEALLASALASDSRFVTQVARHLSTAGGKRFRPMLVIGAAGLGFGLPGGVDDDAAVRAAVVVELTHVASLYHDDVMDEAQLRRSAPSANARWGNSMAILTGDFVFAQASRIVATLGTQYVHFQATTFARLVTGQMDEFAGPEPGANRIEHHLKTVADKTASLIAASTRFGGMVAGVAPDVVEALTRFGEALGTVFQLSDDLLDVVSVTSGKTQGTDLREGVPTLVTLLIQENARPADGRLLELLSGPVAPDDLPEALALVRENPAVEEVRADIARRAGEARNELECLPDGPARQTLSALCDLVVTRSE